jgi:RNA polymerase sigma factor (sigma-70 family)
MSINALHARVCGGEQAAEELLFQSLSDRFQIFAEQRIGDCQDVLEVVQDALMVITSKYREIEFDTSFAAWAYGVLENKLLHYYRQKSTRASHPPELAEGVKPAPLPDPDPGLKNRLLDCLRKVGRANIRYARILNLHYQGYTTDEICDKLNTSRNSSYILVSRARSLMKTCIEGGGVT